MLLAFITNLKDTLLSWRDDNAAMLGAALAYYAIFSLIPLLFLVITSLGYFFGPNMVEGQLVDQLSVTLGKQTAEIIDRLISNISQLHGGIWQVLLGVVLLLFGATGIFRQLETALNMIWSVQPEPGRGIRAKVADQIINFSMVAVVSFLLLTSLIATALISILTRYFDSFLPISGTFLQFANFGVSILIITVLFALVYKILPDVKIPWKYIWGGAAVASVLFVIAKTFIGIYISRSSVISAYGAASSVIILLIWVYFSSQILLFGAEFIKVSARSRGVKLYPENHMYRTKQVRADIDKDEFTDTERALARAFGRLLSLIVRIIKK